MWKQCSEGQSHSGGTCTGSPTYHDWKQALELADGASYAGYSDWHLPNIKELYSLVERACWSPAIDLAAFPSAPSGWFWSASPGASYPYYAWVVYFGYGYGHNYGRNYDGHVRLVRGGQ